MTRKQRDLFELWHPPPAAGLTRETYGASLEAAEAIAPSADTIREEVYCYIRGCGLSGATDDEIQAALGLDGNTERPRRWELFKADRIEASGSRANRRGRRCIVWTASR